jgi:CDP-glycerol glycerophosphotransferase (TagB/SpsB family)
MSWNIFKQFCSNNNECLRDLQVIYGIRIINGDVLEKYLELFLKTKAVIAAEKYNGIDNLFYNIDYIVYIFLGHGVQYIKSYLYSNYLSPKKYNKMLLPPSEIFVSLALASGWKNEDIIKITCPKFDNYEIYKNKKISQEILEKNEKSIFVMFTWRNVTKGKKVSSLYYDNIYKLLNNMEINNQLQLNNVKLYFCYHHSLKEKKAINVENDANIRFISQNEISILLKNSSLIITDFSAILFDAIVQRKPLILYIPDGLDPNLEYIYTDEYYEIITKIKYGILYLNEVFLDFDKFVNKIIYYIKNGFYFEREKLEFYKKFRLSNKGNTRKFINYLKKLK